MAELNFIIDEKPYTATIDFPTVNLAKIRFTDDDFRKRMGGNFWIEYTTANSAYVVTNSVPDKENDAANIIVGKFMEYDKKRRQQNPSQE